MSTHRVLVLDTNVWLDWLVFDDPFVQPLKTELAEGRIEIVIDVPCLQELERVLAYPLGRWTLDAAQQAQCLEHCQRIARTVALTPASSLPRCEDPDDQKFLELADASGADLLLTKDRALLTLADHPALRFHILTPGTPLHYSA